MPPSLESRIDALYQLPLSEFTAARNALAKSLGGADGQRVRHLEKPTVVPWAINQLYWRERPLYDRLIESGAALRQAQVAALQGAGGKKSDVRGASAAHRAAVADAVTAATTIAEASGAHPGADPLSRMLDALSIAPHHPGKPGRLTEIVQPAGFEALLGIGPMPPPRRVERETAVPSKTSTTRTAKPPARESERQRRAREADEKRAREEAAALRRDEMARKREAAARERERAQARKRAEAQLVRAEHQAASARRAFERAQHTLREAERAVAEAKAALRD